MLQTFGDNVSAFHGDEIRSSALLFTIIRISVDETLSLKQQISGNFDISSIFIPSNNLLPKITKYLQLDKFLSFYFKLVSYLIIIF